MQHFPVALFLQNVLCSGIETGTRMEETTELKLPRLSRVLDYPRKAVTTSESGVIQIWSLEIPGPALAVYQLSPSWEVQTHLVFTDSRSRTLMAVDTKLLELKEGRIEDAGDLTVFESPLDFSFGDDRLLVATDNTFSLWSLKGQPELVKEWDQGVRHVLFLPQGKFVTSKENSLTVYNQDLEKTHEYRTVTSVTSLSRYGKGFVIATLGGTLEFYNSELRQLLSLQAAQEGLSGPSDIEVDEKRDELSLQYTEEELYRILEEYSTPTLYQGTAFLKVLSGDAFLMATDFELITLILPRPGEGPPIPKSLVWKNPIEFTAVDVLEFEETDESLEATVLLSWEKVLRVTSTNFERNPILFGRVGSGSKRIVAASFLPHFTTEKDTKRVRETLARLLPSTSRGISDVIADFI